MYVLPLETNHCSPCEMTVVTWHGSNGFRCNVLVRHWSPELTWQFACWGNFHCDVFEMLVKLMVLLWSVELSLPLGSIIRFPESPCESIINWLFNILIVLSSCIASVVSLLASNIILFVQDNHPQKHRQWKTDSNEEWLPWNFPSLEKFQSLIDQDENRALIFGSYEKSSESICGSYSLVARVAFP